MTTSMTRLMMSGMILMTLSLQTTHQMKILEVCRPTALFQWLVLLYTTLMYVQCMPIEYYALVQNGQVNYLEL